MAIARIFFGLILIFVFVAFSLKNMGPISVDLYFIKTPELPLFVWLFFSALFGVIVAWLVAISEQLRMRRELKKERKEKKDLEDRVGKLKEEVNELEERLRQEKDRREASSAVVVPPPPAGVESQPSEPQSAGQPSDDADANVSSDEPGAKGGDDKESP